MDCCDECFGDNLVTAPTQEEEYWEGRAETSAAAEAPPRSPSLPPDWTAEAQTTEEVPATQAAEAPATQADEVHLPATAGGAPLDVPMTAGGAPSNEEHYPHVWSSRRRFVGNERVPNDSWMHSMSHKLSQRLRHELHRVQHDNRGMVSTENLL